VRIKPGEALSDNQGKTSGGGQILIADRHFSFK
jgi:hypothetical protein